jgi:hypothetical protein
VERVNKVLIRHSPCSVRAEAWASRCRLCISIVIVENAVLSASSTARPELCTYVTPICGSS